MKNSLITFIIATSVLLVGCGKPTAPSSQQVLDYLNSRLPSGVPIQFASPSLETFPESEGHCRVKYKVTVHLNDDLLSLVSPGEALKAAGWEPKGYSDALTEAADIDEPFKSSLATSRPTTRLADLKLAKVASKAGVESPVYGTLEAERQADDTWTFSPLESSNVTKDIPGQFTLKNAPGHFLLLDSDEGKKAVADEIDREKAFVTAVVTAKQQSDAARATQIQQHADSQAALVKQLLDATAPGKTYVGLLTSGSKSTTIKLVFMAQQDGGKIITAEFQNPSDPSQARALTGSLKLDSKKGLPIHLAEARTKAVTAALPDPVLTYWLENHGAGVDLNIATDGSLSGRGGFDGQWQFDLKTIETAATNSLK